MKRLTQAEKDAREEQKEMHAAREYARYLDKPVCGIVERARDVSKFNRTWKKVFA